MLREYLYDPANSATGTFLCGPPGLVEKAFRPMLRKCGAQDADDLFGF
jgi:nitrate reductase (NAD(P)H)